MKTYKGTLEGAGLRVGIVVSRFNSVVTERLLTGALDGLRTHGVHDDDIQIVHVPGAFELPLFAKVLADTGRISAVVCLGAVVRGETPHFEYISSAVVTEICRLASVHSLPITLGVLTTNSIEQALERAGASPGNKGYEAAVTAIEMANLRKVITG